MKAALVVLADHVVQNYARSIVVELYQRSKIPFYASLLPSHVSLKQPFSFESVSAITEYFDSLAARTQPFLITLDGLYCETWNGYGILGLNVVETPTLRALHNQLNTELPAIVKDASAPHDGSGYHFHLTIEMGKISQSNPYQEFFETLPNPGIQFTFTARQIAMFFYPDGGESTGSFVTYRVQPLGE